MNFIKKCPVFLCLTASGLLLALAGVCGRFSIYKEYEFDIVKRPFLALVMEGAAKGTAPWEAAGNFGMGKDEFPGSLLALVQNRDRGQSIRYEDGGNALETFAEENAAPDDGEDSLAAEMEENTKDGGEAATGPETDETSEKITGKEDSAGEGEESAKEQLLEEEKTYNFQTVTEDYFNDAAFIGDSRTVGLFEYGGIEERADFYAKISLTIYNVFTESLARDEETGKKITAEEALTRKQYGKVYLMLGINEMGTGTTETFMEEYKAVVDRIRELQPDAVIFVEGIMKVTGSKDAEDPIFNNKNIEEKNAAIAQLADNRNIFYIDVNEAVCDAEGNLNAEYTIDEVHLKAKYYEIWKQFLLEHGIER